MVWTGDERGTLAPSLVAWFEQADAGWPNRSTLSDGSLGDTAHAARTSDHNPKTPNPPGWVDAGDLTRDDVRGPNLDRLWQYLISRRDPRVKYVIYRGQIVKSYVDSSGHPAWVPQPYTGANAHDKHMHISVTAEGRADSSPWFPPAPLPARPTLEDDMPVHYRPLNHADTGTYLVQGNVRWLVPNQSYNEALTGDGYPEKSVGPATWDCIRNVTTLNLELLLDGDGDTPAIITGVLEGLHDVTLSDEQVRAIIEAMPAAVKQALREGTG